MTTSGFPTVTRTSEPGFATIAVRVAGIVLDRRAHLLEHRAERNENRLSADKRREDAILLVDVRLGVNVMVVE